MEETIEKPKKRRTSSKKEVETTNLEKTELNLQYVSISSPIYMVIFMLASLLVVGSMFLQYLMVLQTFTLYEVEVSIPSIIIPYDIIIKSMIFYMGSIGFYEGTRSIVKTSKNEGKMALNMPKYKRRRLLIMTSMFALLGITSLLLQVMTINTGVKTDFFVSDLFYGVGAGMSFLAYGDYGPKLANDIFKKYAFFKKDDEELIKK